VKPLKSGLPREEFKARGYKTTPTPFFLLKSKKNGLGYPRIGIVIGKAIYKEATRRNFWKRQARIKLLNTINEGTDILMIFVSSRNKTKLTKKQFQEDLDQAINKIK
jgi:ribonuclease P protein component